MPTAQADAGQPTDAGVAQLEPVGPARRLYVLGSSVNLRKEASAQAEVVDKLPIGTECATASPDGSEWPRVDCGGRAGFISASMLGPEKPSVEQHRAEAQDAQRPLAQRLESALRAATLAPEDAALRKLLGELFYERHLELAAADKPLKPRRTFERSCHQMDANECIRMATGSAVNTADLWSVTRNGYFVSAIGTPERVHVYRGRFTYPEKRKDTESYPLKGEVLAMESFTPAPVLLRAIFSVHGDQGRYTTYVQDENPRSRPLGELVLDEASQALLRALPQRWARLEVAKDVQTFSKFVKSVPFEMLWNCPESKPLMLEFEVDIHGRWNLHEALDAVWPWISAVEKVEGGLLLTLVTDSQYLHGKRTTTTKQVLFKLPRENEDVAWLGDVPYSSKLGGYPQKILHPCR